MLKKVLITEDHPLYREALVMLLQRKYPQTEVVEAEDYLSTMQCLERHADVQLHLLDIHIPGTTGLAGLKEICTLYPSTPLVVVSTLDLNASVQQMLQLGANGFIAKTTPSDIMCNAIETIIAGEVVVITDRKQEQSIQLSKRELETLGLLAKGYSNKQIASGLGVSYPTAREYVSKIFRRLNVDNRLQAVQQAKSLGLVLDSECVH